MDTEELSCELINADWNPLKGALRIMVLSTWRSAKTVRGGGSSLFRLVEQSYLLKKRNKFAYL